MTAIAFQRLTRFAQGAALVLLLAAFLPLAGAQTFGGRSIDDLKQSATTGDVQAQLLLGDALLNGKGVEKNPVEGVMWIRKAADQGAPDAFYILGICHDIGSGVTRDVKQAADWYRKAAETGIVDAQYNLADCYLRGEGVEKDVNEAVRWLEQAADKGDAAAVAQLGFIYLNDTFGVRDPAKAATYLRKAAYTGNSAAAKWALGTLYQSGEGVAQSDEDAVKWFKDSAMQGDSTGMYHLAMAMLSGKGTPKDELRATEWMEKSAAKGNPKAGKFLADKAQPSAADPAPPQAPAVTKPVGPTAPKPSFVSSAKKEAPRESFTSFVSTPPGTEPKPREQDNPPGFSPTAPTAAAATNKTAGGFTSFVKSFGTTNPAGSAAGSVINSAEEMARQAAGAAMTKITGEKMPGNDTNGGTAKPEQPSFAEKAEDPSLPAFAKKGPDVKTAAAPATPMTPAAGETRVVYRDNGAGQAFPVAIAYTTLAMAIAMVVISLMFFLTFKTRIRSLEGEIKKAQFELSKANVNLSSMMHQVEQLALQAPEDNDEGTGAFVSLPEWDDIKSQATAEGFKISRTR